MCPPDSGFVCLGRSSEDFVAIFICIQRLLCWPGSLFYVPSRIRAVILYCAHNFDRILSPACGNCACSNLSTRGHVFQVLSNTYGVRSSRRVACSSFGRRLFVVGVRSVLFLSNLPSRSASPRWATHVNTARVDARSAPGRRHTHTCAHKHTM